MASTVPTRFLIISDTHDLDIIKTPIQLPTPRADVLLHCGDLTEYGGLPTFEKAVRMPKDIDAELKLVIAGNHDLELDEDFWQAQFESPNHSRPGDLGDHVLAKRIMTGPKLLRQASRMLLKEPIRLLSRMGQRSRSTHLLTPLHSPIGLSLTSLIRIVSITLMKRTSPEEPPRWARIQFQTTPT